MRCSDYECAPLGIHGDGVPWGNNQSVEVFSWNFIAMPSAQRFLFGTIEKQWLCRCGCHGRHTINKILDVFVWSMKCLYEGIWPHCRHDSTPFGQHDKERAKHTGELGFRASLQQCRGDWAWFKQLFGFKGWSSNQMCWLCSCTKSTMTDFDLGAEWRACRHTTGSMLALLRRQGIWSHLCLIARDLWST